MAIPEFLLNKMFPRLSLSKINVEGTEENINISFEIEIIEPERKRIDSYVNSGYGLYATDSDISSISNLQNLFAAQVRNKDIIDISSSTLLEQKNINEGNRRLVSKTYSSTIQQFFLDKKNIIVFYGSWIEEPVTGKLTFSTTTAEILFEDGQIKSESYIYFIKGTEDIWDGAIARTQDGLSYITDENPPRELERYVTKNYKIQDFRTKKQIEKKIYDYQEINNKLLNARSRQLIKQDTRKQNYFTDLYLSQKEDLSLVFGINFRDLVLNNSILGKDPGLSLDTTQRLFENSRIVDLKIVKRRVQEVADNNNPLTDIRKIVKPFYNSENVVISSGKDEEDSFIGSDNIKETNIICQDMKNKMRFFSCIDKKDFSSDPSLYQYGVRIEIQDGSKRIILSDIQEIHNSIVKLKQYYSEIDIFVNTNQNTTLYTEEDIENHVSLYMNKLSRYYSITEYRELQNKLVSQLSPVTLDPQVLNNFITLNQNLLSNLQNMIGDKISSFDDPHIEKDFNEANNTNDTFFIEHYFDNNIYDFSLFETKKLEYFPKQNSNMFFNEYKFSNLNSLKGKNILKTDSGRPVVTEVSPFSISYNAARKEIGGSQTKQFNSLELTQLDKIIRENLLKHVNIDISKIYLKETGFKQTKEQEKEDNIYEEDLSVMYKYFSSTNVDNKEIDEVFDLYEDYKDDFIARIQFLKNYNTLTGAESWFDLSQISDEIFLNESGFLICRIRPNSTDYRNTKRRISHNLRSIDIHFLISVEGIEDIRSSYSSFFGSESTPRTPRRTTIKTKPEEKKKALTIQDAETAPTQRSSVSDIDIDSQVSRETIKTKADKVKKSTRNWVLNG